MRLNPYFSIFLAVVIAGSGGVFVKVMELPPTIFAWYRCFMPAAILGTWMAYRQGLFFWKGNHREVLTASVFQAIRLYFFFAAFSLTSIGNAVVMFYTWPLFGNLLGALYLKEKIPARNKLLLFAAFLGILIIYSDKPFDFESNDFKGMTMMIAAAFMHAASVVLFKKASHRYQWYEKVFYQNIMGIFIFLPFLLLDHGGISAGQFGGLTVYTLLIAIGAFGLFFYGLHGVKASTASLIAYVEVISACIFGIIFFDEVLTWNFILGGIIILSSSIFLKRSTSE